MNTTTLIRDEIPTSTFKSLWDSRFTQYYTGDDDWFEWNQMSKLDNLHISNPFDIFISKANSTSCPQKGHALR